MFDFCIRARRTFLVIPALVAFVVPLSAQALMDISEVDIFWLHDRTDGVAGGTPYGFEIDVSGFELASVEVVEPGGVSGGAGSHILTPDGPGQFYLDQSNSFADFSSLMASYPGNAVTPWAFNFTSTNGAFDDDTFNVILDPSELTGFLDILTPTHNSPITASPSITWTDCSSCGGNVISAYLVDLFIDSDIDELVTQTMTTTSWNPSNSIDLSHLHEIEAIIGDYSDLAGFLGNPQESTTGGDTFNFVAGYESVNILFMTPEPGTGVLVSLGLMGLSVLGRRRA